MANDTKIMIFDAETRSALATLRTLAHKGVPTVIASYKRNALSFSSRDACERFIYPNPAKGKQAFVRAVGEYFEKYPNTIPMTFTDITTDALRCIDLPSVQNHFPSTPHKDMYERATNKRALAVLASAYGLPVPEEIDKNIFQENSIHQTILFPVIIKPVRSVSWHGDVPYKDTAQVAHTREEFLKRYAHLCAHTTETPLIQKMIYGDEFGVSVLADHGTVKAVFAHKRLRSITPHGGVSTLRESVPVSDEMMHIATTLTRALSWHGVMMIELKQNNITGKLTLIEVNARFWGSLFLAIQSGVNFPYLLYLLATGKLENREYPTYRIGVRARHIITDVSHYYALGRRSFLPKHLKEFFTFFKKDLYFDVWSLRDPVPGFVELFQFIKKKI